MLGEDNQVHQPPTRDAATLKNVLYGPGHEKFPSWPISAAAEAPIATRAPPTGTSQRSKSWTDHTNYPKENIVPYTRPYMRRPHPHQLKPVIERCEKQNAQEQIDYLNIMERLEKQIDNDNLPSPPVRDSNQHKQLQDYEKLLEDQSLLRYSFDVLSKENTTPLTQADLEEYTRTCEELNIQHQKQPSYAQSEGYHSYVSSTDSTSTPFLDRLRRDIDTNVLRGSSSSWDHDSIVTTSSGSASSSETLKWRGSLSDVSVASSSFNTGRQQLIAHSARVQTPQRHNSESVLYIENNRNEYPSNIARSYYNATNCTGSQLAEPQSVNSLSHSPPSPQRTVAERIHQYEKQTTKYTYLDPDKKTKVSDPALKAIQKKALLLFYERHQNQNKGSWRSEPKLNVKPGQHTTVDVDISSDNVNSQNSLKTKLDTESVVHKSKRLPCALDFKSQRQVPLGAKPDQHNSYINKLDLNEPVRDHIESKISIMNSNYSSNKNIPELPKKHSNNLVSNFEDAVRRLGTKTGKIPSPREINSHERSSSIDLSNYSSTNILPEPPLTTETQNSDLQGPIILGNSISVDDWVPERPPKNQELLRSVYPDLYQDKNRYHSPELPLPSPPLPICDDESVCASDEPFPPPPLEIIDELKYQQEVLDIQPQDLNFNRNSMPESQKPGKYAVKDTNILDELNSTNNISSTPLTKPKPVKREYPSRSKVNIASRRNSFANAQDLTKESPVFAANIRASVREKPNQFSSSKLVLSAQRQLYRSITVDQSASIPKKPINPFLRSTSMRHDVDHNKEIISHNTINFEKSSVRPDRVNYHHHYNQKQLTNGMHLLPTQNNTPSKVSGHFRAEPMWITPPVIDSKSPDIKIDKIPSNDINPAWRPMDTRRVSLPCKPSEDRLNVSGRHEYQRNASFDGSDFTKISYSFCETDVENITAKTADVRSINSDNVKKSSQWTNSSTPLKAIHQPDSNLRRQSATAGIHTEHEKGTPDVNIGSYKKINVSIEKNFSNTECKDAKESKLPIVSNNNSPLKEVPIAEHNKTIYTEVKEKINTTIEENENLLIDNKIHDIIEDSLPDLLIKKDNCDKETSLVCDQKNLSAVSDVSLSDDDVVTKSSLNSSKICKSERLKPRMLLPEENVWEVLRTQLSSRLQPDTQLMNLISQYDEYNNTIESITNIFELDVMENSDTPNENLTDNDSENDLNINGTDLTERRKEAQALIEHIQNLKIDCSTEKDEDGNWESFKANTCKCLESLVMSLTAEGVQLEQAASVNEAVGIQLLATASKSAKLSRHAADVGRVTALISGLATRLARATRPLKLTVHSPERRKMLMVKQEELADQLEEAKKLKENIDARGLTLSENLSVQVSDEFKEQYKTFISTKVKLVVYLKDVQYRIDLAKQLLDSFRQDANYITSAVRTQVLI